jgi:TPR repeat protein
MRIGKYDMGGRPIELYDCGTPYFPPPPTPEQIAAQKQAQAEAQAKAAEQKKNTEEIALKSNQDAAAKGDAYGLMRMGERYRDGDGVEKDLAKANEYLQKAADAGSTTAAEELSRLKQ